MFQKIIGSAGVLFFNCAYLLVAILNAAGKANYEFMLYIGVVTIAVIVIGLLHWKLRFDLRLLWLLSFWGFLHMSGGLVIIPDSWPRGAEKPVLYNWWLIKDIFKFDNFVHGYGFGVTTWLLWQISQRLKTNHGYGNGAGTSFWLLILCIFGSMGLGALNEMIEFVITLLLPETNVGGYINTGWDLIFNMIGAFMAAMVIYLNVQCKEKRV